VGISNCSSWHAYAKLVSKFPYNQNRISPTSLSILPVLLSRSHFVEVSSLHMQMAVRGWRLTEEHPLQFGLNLRAVGSPGEGPSHSFFPLPADHNTTFVPFPYTNMSMQHIRSEGSKLFCPLPESAFTFLLELQIVQITLIITILNVSSNYLSFQASFTCSHT
jgi:hypothetical protein